MKSKDFNKIGDTSFRVKSQVIGYVQVANFLLNEMNDSNNIDIEKNKLNDKFKEFCEREQIYEYKNDKKINDRLSFVLKLFERLNIIEKNNEKIKLFKNKLLEILEDPYESFFNKMYNQLYFFRLGIDALLNHSKLDVISFIHAIQVIEPNENFDDIYRKFKNNYYETMKELVYNLFETQKFDTYNITDNFKPLYRKKGSKTEQMFEMLEKVFLKIKNEEEIDASLLEQASKYDIFKHILKIKGYTLNKKFNKKDKLKLKEYLSNNNANDFFIDINVAKIYSNIGKEYFDLMKRWFNDFGLLEKNNVIDKNISKVNEKIEIEEIQKIFKCYPYTLSEIKLKLSMINENKFEFKHEDKNIVDVENSTLAEYFVNVYYAIKFDIDPSKFSTHSRTKLKPGTLYPLIHAPGKGPDMYFIKNDNLISIETTIHNTVKNVINNEAYNVIDHINLNHINEYIKNEETSQKIKNTQIILVFPLKEKGDIKKVKEWIENQYYVNKTEYGKQKKLSILNFKMLANEEDGLI